MVVYLVAVDEVGGPGARHFDGLPLGRVVVTACIHSVMGCFLGKVKSFASCSTLLYLGPKCVAIAI